MTQGTIFSLTNTFCDFNSVVRVNVRVTVTDIQLANSAKSYSVLWDTFRRAFKSNDAYLWAFKSNDAYLSP